MGSPAIDYDALARQHGLTPAPIDYDALAKAHGLTPAEQPGAVSRFVQGTGIPGTLNALMKPSDKPSDPAHPYADAPIIKNAWEMVKSIGQATKDRLARADKAEEDGDYLGAIGHGLAAIPGAGEMGAQIIQNFRDGNIAGGLGGLATVFGPKAVKAASPAIAGAADVAGTAAKDAMAAIRPTTTLADIKAGGRAFMESPKASQPIPGTGSMPPMLVDALKLHPKTAAAGNLLQRYENAQAAIAVNQGARAPVQIPEGGWPEAAPAEPAPPLTPQQSAVIDANAAARAARGQVPAAQPVKIDWSGLSDPATLEQAAKQLAANRAARSAANPQSAAATIERIKAIGGTKATPSMGDLAVPRDLNSQLQNYLGKLRALDPDYEGQPAPEPELSDLLQQSLDALKAKKK